MSVPSEDETVKFNRLFALFSSVGYPDIDKGRCREDFEYRHALTGNLLSGQAAEIARILNDGIDLVQFQIEDIQEELASIRSHCMVIDARNRTCKCRYSYCLCQR